MNERLLYLLCAAIDEMLSKVFKCGPAGKEFRDYWAGIRKGKELCDVAAPCADASGPERTVDDGHLAEVEGLRAENARLSEEKEKLRAEMESGQTELATFRRTVQELQGRLEQERQARAEAQTRAEQKKSRLSEQDVQQLERTADFLRAVSSEAAAVLAAHYELTSLQIFLVQCGQFPRLSRCWEACGRSIAAGASGPALTDVLLKLLELHNLGSDGATATAIMFQPGDRYDYERADRFASDGTTVRNLLLPGLCNAGGKIMHKALVQLG